MTKLKEASNENIKKKIDTYRLAIENLLDELGSKKFATESGHDFSQLEKEENKISQELSNMRIKEENLTVEINELVRKINSVSEEENKLWIVINEAENRIAESQEEKERLKVSTNLIEDELRNYFKSYILDDLFDLTIQDNLATVNGLKLGLIKGVLF